MRRRKPASKVSASGRKIAKAKALKPNNPGAGTPKRTGNKPVSASRGWSAKHLFK